VPAKRCKSQFIGVGDPQIIDDISGVEGDVEQMLVQAFFAQAAFD